MYKFIKYAITLFIIGFFQYGFTAEADKTMRIMPLGDSITFGINYPGAYRIKLEQLLNQHKISFTFVGSQSNGPDSLVHKSNEGHTGEGIDFIQQNANEWVKSYSPDVILLMIGTNDVWPYHRDDVIAIDTLIEKMKSLIDTIVESNPNIKLAVSSIPPSLDYWNRWVVKFNLQLSQLVTQKYASKNVIFVDSYSKLEHSDFDLNDGMDGIHPNAKGYDKIGEAFFTAPFFHQSKNLQNR